MQIVVDELANSLSRLCKENIDSLPSIILINGNEPLLIEEALDQAREILKSAGFSERIKLQSETGFDWSSVTGVGRAMSLFSERRIIELRIPKSLGVPGSKALIEYCDSPPDDDLLIVIMPALDKRQRQAKWAKVVLQHGWMVDCVDITPQQFPRWIKQRFQSRALRVENGVVDLLVEQLEGNILAAAQEIDKLQVLAESGAVSLKLVSESLADQAKFDVYALTDVCLAGNFAKALRIKQRLQSEGIEPVIVVWALVREIRALASISSAIEAGQNRSQVFKQNRVWSKRESLVNAALKRANSNYWYQLLERAAHLDQTVKGQRFSEVGSVWHQIESLCTAVCGVEVIQTAV